VEEKKNSPLESFQVGLAALEQIVNRLESGEIALEDALLAFEDGVRLVRLLNEKLSAVERRVEVLTRGEGGTLRLTPWSEEGE
jgi:exodeoxyribonuclease VII small subunit